MSRSDFHSKCHYILATLVAFSIPLAKFTPFFIGLLLFNWLVEGDLQEKFKQAFKNKFAVLFGSFFFIHIVGLLYTSNLDSGLFDIEVKLSLIIFPLVLSSKPLSNKQVKYVFKAFIIGLIYASFYMLSRALSFYYVYGENTFYYGKLAGYIHTSYISMYLNFAIVWLLFRLFIKENDEKLINKITIVGVITLFSIMIILFASKSGIATLLLIGLGLNLYFIYYRRKYLVAFVGLVLLAGGIFSVVHLVPQVMNRVNNFVQEIDSENNNEMGGSTENRIQIWKSSNLIISKNLLLGVGTGDVKEALQGQYKKNGFQNALKRNLNAHNEYYQVFISLGIVGFILLLMSMIYPLAISFKHNNYTYLFFLLIVMLNFLTESILETQAGVVFYAFFNSLLCFKKKEFSN